jgi:hypothetical protein
MIESTFGDLLWSFEPALHEFQTELRACLLPYVVNRIGELIWALEEHLERQPGHKVACTFEASGINLPGICMLLVVKIRRRDGSYPPLCAAYVGSREYVQIKADEAKALMEKALNKPGVEGAIVEEVLQ